MPLHVLAFDTSSQRTAVAITRGEHVLCELSDASEARHAQTLLPRVQACLAEAKLTLEDIGLIAVGIGPGSFTGVRVGLATAKGFALANGVHVRGVVSLAALARAAFEAPDAAPQALVAPVLDAHKSEVFAALYARANDGAITQLLAPFHAPPELAAARLSTALEGRGLQLFGTGFRRYAEQISVLLPQAHVLADTLDEPRAACVAREGLHAYLSEGASDLAGLLPMYLRDSDAQLPKSPLRL